MRLNKSQRHFLADKLGDLANYAMVGLVFGQIALKAGRRLEVIILGTVVYGILLLSAVKLGR